MSCLLIFFTAQAGIGIGDSDGQLGCSFHNVFAVLGGNTVGNLSTFVAHQQYFQLLDVVDQELLEAPRQHVLCFLLLNLPQTLLSIPLSFCQLHLVLTYQSNWCWMNFLVLFLMILDFTRGLRAAMMPSRGWLPPPQAPPRKRASLFCHVDVNYCLASLLFSLKNFLYYLKTDFQIGRAHV